MGWVAGQLGVVGSALAPRHAGLLGPRVRIITSSRADGARFGRRSRRATALAPRVRGLHGAAHVPSRRLERAMLAMRARHAGPAHSSSRRLANRLHRVHGPAVLPPWRPERAVLHVPDGHAGAQHYVHAALRTWAMARVCLLRGTRLRRHEAWTTAQFTMPHGVLGPLPLGWVGPEANSQA